MDSKDSESTDFGYDRVSPEEKTERVGNVFTSVAGKYDIMNDLMSFGLHRLWKRYAVEALALRKGQQVLDLAAGTGDLTRLVYPKVGKSGRVILVDINEAMLKRGQERLLDCGLFKGLAFVVASAEALPFPDNHFDRIMMSFGLRNVTDKDKALAQMYRVLRPGGKAIVLEFSQTDNPILSKLYDVYSFQVLPRVGKLVAKDAESYRYLAESIRMHPDQESLKAMMVVAGFEDVSYQNMASGIVALHQGYKYE
jgi:demethylmenaquinone methyltransferase/2-methoxy-6-polyprenyl-1,4-benzoquinol methylase